VNEVVPWSTRARDALAALGSRVEGAAIAGRDWFIDLGQGAWLLGLAVVVVVALGIAVVVSHGDSGTSACQTADPFVSSILALDGEPSLTSSQANRLHADSTQLAALAKGAAGETRTALAYAADVSGAAQQGQPFDSGFTEGKYVGVCSFSRGAGGGGGPRAPVG
jgi:hypothetical protein